MFGAVGMGLSTLIVSIQAIVLVPMYLSRIGPEIYGAWLASAGVVVWLQTFDFGVPNLMIQRVGAAHARGDRDDVAVQFTSAMVIIGVIGVAALALSFVFAEPIAGVMGVGDGEVAEFASALRIVGLSVALSLVNHGAVGLGRGVQRQAALAAGYVLGAILCFASTVLFLLLGWEVAAIAYGLLVRSATVSVVGLLFVAGTMLRGELGRPAIGRRQLAYYLKVSPLSALGGMAYSSMGQLEVALAGAILGPSAALVLSLNRRLVLAGRAFIEVISFATYGSFSHLASAGTADHTGYRYRQIAGLRFGIAAGFVSVFYVVNESFIRLWVDPSLFGGYWLTILLGLHLLLTGDAFLRNYLLRASGRVVAGSVAISVEAVVRLVVAAVCLQAWGLEAMLLSTILIAAVASAWTHRALLDHIGASNPGPFPGPYSAGNLALVLGAAAALVVHAGTWVALVAVAAVSSLAVAALELSVSRMLRTTGRELIASLRRR